MKNKENKVDFYFLAMKSFYNGKMELKPGDKVVWFKRIPGGDYVYPVAGKVLGFTKKRVKIEADDDGEITVRYVDRGSLQKLE